MSSLETLELEPLAMNEWMGRAACKGMVSELWDDNVPDPDALRVCFRCPVQRDCLQYGLRRAFASDAGVLGGTGVYDRQRIRAGKVTVRQVLMAINLLRAAGRQASRSRVDSASVGPSHGARVTEFHGLTAAFARLVREGAVERRTSGQVTLLKAATPSAWTAASIRGAEGCAASPASSSV
jgi:hypothetical protein